MRFVTDGNDQANDIGAWELETQRLMISSDVCMFVKVRVRACVFGCKYKLLNFGDSSIFWHFWSESKRLDDHFVFGRA